jgi:hypothetical protein
MEKYWGSDVMEFKPERWDQPLSHAWQFIPFQKGMATFRFLSV